MAQSFSVRYAESLESVEADAWDACANPPDASDSVGERHNPFVAHAFLRALEASKSVGARAGWSPAHTLVEDSRGRLVACAPAYIKTHSLGEYVFDQNWAQAYELAGGRYYPKIQVAAPFTPVTGRRLLVAQDAPEGARDALILGLQGLRKASGASSIHVTFCTEEESVALSDAGFISRAGEQFHFVNEGYADFDDFLSRLTARKRKSIKRERREALGDDLKIDLLTGSDIRPAHWDSFFEFYMDTGARKWGHPYLTRAFFDEVGARMADRILLVMARRGARHIAGAINFLGDDAIYGRNWGALEPLPFLHFEVCYYQAIEFAIRRGYKRVEAGAQGEHKIARGYRPTITHSAHHFADARLGQAVSDFLTRERAAVAEWASEHAAELPYKTEPGG
ncbi:MAG: GNAT family N-acetyltransferase [Methylocystis sp.]|uniref:GNAT family N-acetyltransferase n=1 Tax=Methylocystis sp. TaxID=1911079 RepID=UPI003D10B5D7